MKQVRRTPCNAVQHLQHVSPHVGAGCVEQGRQAQCTYLIHVPQPATCTAAACPSCADEGAVQYKAAQGKAVQ